MVSIKYGSSGCRLLSQESLISVPSRDLSANLRFLDTTILGAEHVKEGQSLAFGISTEFDFFLPGRLAQAGLRSGRWPVWAPPQWQACRRQSANGPLSSWMLFSLPP